ncbi:hypothetical protein ABFX02_05G006800 [Erythranthe guttata]
MASISPNFSSVTSPICTHAQKSLIAFRNPFWRNPFFRKYPNLRFSSKSNHCKMLVLSCLKQGVGSVANAVIDTEIPKSNRVRAVFDLSEEQKQAISQLPSKMTNRCKLLMKEIICFSPENGSVPLMLAAWVKSTNPRRTDWLSVFKELEALNHPLYFEVAEHAFAEESFEANIRDYTNIIHGYAKQNRLQEAEQTLTAMKNRGLLCDQVILTALIHMYSKSGNLKQAQDSFEEMKMLGVQLDRRSYGSIIMAHIRAKKLSSAETLLQEMEAQEIYAGREVYKALLRAYSMKGDFSGAQRIFDAIQVAGITPDARVCGLLINAYVVSGRAQEACVAFGNMRRSGIEVNDKCVALVLAAYEMEDKLKEALDLLIELEGEGIMVGKEGSDLLVKWFQKLGVVEEVAIVLRELGLKMAQPIL